jgi:hypothetical protein
MDIISAVGHEMKEIVLAIKERIIFFLDPNARRRDRVRRFAHRPVLPYPYSLLVPWIALAFGFVLFLGGCRYIFAPYLDTWIYAKYWVYAAWLYYAKFMWALVFIVTYGDRIYNFFRIYHKACIREFIENYELYLLLAGGAMAAELETDGALVKTLLWLPGYVLYWHFPFVWRPLEGWLSWTNRFAWPLTVTGWQWILFWCILRGVGALYNRVSRQWVFATIWTTFWIFLETWRRGKGLPWPYMHTREVLGLYGQCYSVFAVIHRAYLLWMQGTPYFFTGTQLLYWGTELIVVTPPITKKLGRWFRWPWTWHANDDSDYNDDDDDDDGGDGGRRRGFLGWMRRLLGGHWTWRANDDSNDDDSSDSDPDAETLTRELEQRLIDSGFDRGTRRRLLTGGLGLAGLRALIDEPATAALSWRLLADNIITEEELHILSGGSFQEIRNVLSRATEQGVVRIMELLRHRYSEASLEERGQMDLERAQHLKRQAEIPEEQRQRRKAEKMEKTAGAKVAGAKAAGVKVAGVKAAEVKAAESTFKSTHKHQKKGPIIWATGVGYKAPGEDSDTTEEEDAGGKGKGPAKGKTPTKGKLKPPGPEAPPGGKFGGSLSSFHDKYQLDSNDGQTLHNRGKIQKTFSEIGTDMSASFYVPRDSDSSDEEEDAPTGLPGGSPGWFNWLSSADSTPSTGDGARPRQTGGKSLTKRGIDWLESLLPNGSRPQFARPTPRERHVAAAARFRENFPEIRKSRPTRLQAEGLRLSQNPRFQQAFNAEHPRPEESPQFMGIWPVRPLFPMGSPTSAQGHPPERIRSPEYYARKRTRERERYYDERNKERRQLKRDRTLIRREKRRRERERKGEEDYVPSDEDLTDSATSSDSDDGKNPSDKLLAIILRNERKQERRQKIQETSDDSDDEDPSAVKMLATILRNERAQERRKAQAATVEAEKLQKDLNNWYNEEEDDDEYEDAEEDSVVPDASTDAPDAEPVPETAKQFLKTKKIQLLEERRRLKSGEFFFDWPESDNEGREDWVGNFTPPLLSENSGSGSSDDSGFEVSTEPPTPSTESSEEEDNLELDPDWEEPPVWEDKRQSKSGEVSSAEAIQSKNGSQCLESDAQTQETIPVSTKKGKGEGKPKNLHSKSPKEKSAPPNPTKEYPPANDDEVVHSFASGARRFLAPILVRESPEPTFDPLVFFGRGERYMTPEDMETEAWAMPKQPPRPQRNNPWRMWYLLAFALCVVWYAVGDVHRVREDYMYGSGLDLWEDVPEARLAINSEDLKGSQRWDRPYRVVEASSL